MEFLKMQIVYRGKIQPIYVCFRTLSASDVNLDLNSGKVKLKLLSAMASGHQRQ